MTSRIFIGVFAIAMASSVQAQEARVTPVATASSPAPAITEDLSVALDFARLMRVPNETSTLVLGNPAIADATIQKNGLIVVTGKSYGTTNLLALDRDGQTLHEMLIHVTAPNERTLTVLRGTSRETWSCAPRCEHTVTLGDSPDFFGANSGQISSRNGLASGR